MFKQTKRIISMVLCLALVFSVFGIIGTQSVYAAFSDTSGHWAESVIDKWSAKGVLSGDGDGTFRPDDSITRAEFAKVIVTAKGYTDTASISYTDVAQNAWYYSSLSLAAAAGIINGYEDGSFRPEAQITREEACAVISRAYGISGGGSGSFTDSAQISDWAKTYVSQLSSNNIIKGYEDGSFRPQSPITRAETVQILDRVSVDESLPTLVPDNSEETPAPTATPNSASMFGGGGGGGGGGTVTTSSYTVTFDLNYEGATGAPAAQRVKKGEKATKPENPVRDNYAFLGWSATKEGQELFDFDSVVIASVTLYAVWVPIGGSDFYTVTFLLNDGSPGAYDVQTVAANDFAVKPADPESEYYKFSGWYTEAAAINEFDFSTKITGDLMLYAGWGSPDGIKDDELYVASSGTETIYSITGIDIIDDKAYVTVNANSKSILVLSFLDENTSDLITSAAAYTPDYCEMVNIEVPLPSNLPQYFIVEAQLINDNNDPLCDSFRFIEYTSAYEEFKNLTVNDFEGQTVINYDEDETNNFGVLAPETKILESNDNVNIVSLSKDMNDPSGSNAYYTIANPSDDALNLASGDCVYFDGTDYMFKIDTINNQDGKLIITSAEDSTMEDFYDVIKIDMDIHTDAQQNEMVESSSDEASLDVEIIDVDGDWSTDIGIGLEREINDHVKVSGNLKGKATISVKMTYDAHLFSDDYFYCSFKTEAEFDVNVQLTASIDNSEKNKTKFEARKISIPTPITGLDVYVQPSIPLDWEISGSGKLDFNYKQASGFTYDTYSGKQPIDEKHYSLSLSLEGKAEVSFGPKIEAGVGWGKNPANDKYIVSANIGGQYGIKFTATLAADIVNVTNEDSKHACAVCLEGEAKWFVTVDAKLEFYITKKLSATPIDLTLFNYETWLDILNLFDEGKFYVSIVNSDDSVFHGHLKIGPGSCPNKTYRTTFVSKNADGNDISSNLTISKQSGQNVESGTTTFNKYLYDGAYKATGNVDGNNITKSFTVNGRAQTVTLSADSADGSIRGSVKTADTSEPISDAKVLIKENGIEVASQKTNASGDYSISLSEGTYTVVITKDGYIPFSTVEKVENGTVTYVAASLMVGDSSVPGGFSGTILDATNNNPIPGVHLSLRYGWNNSSEGEILMALTTDDNGKFEYQIHEFFGITLGILPGNYTLTASKENYTTKSFNIIVLPGVVTANQNASLSPTMSDGNYRFVLRWGMDPRDLDSHLVGPNGENSTFHTWYSNKTCYNSDGIVADLDLDDVDGEGPETTTIRKAYDGIYYFYVHHYAGNGTIATSGAYVEVYKGDTKIATYYAPTDGGDGIYWNVFTLNTATNEIRPGNTITDSPITSANLLSGEQNDFDDILTMIAEDIESSVK